MNNTHSRLLLLLSLLVACPAWAQWPPYSTPNVPLTAEGEPNLDASPPRTPWGDPDMSGIWDRYRGFGAEIETDDPDAPPQATFFDLGSNMEEGLPYTEWAKQLKEARMADNMKDNPDALCLPIGHMQLHQHPQPHNTLVVWVFSRSVGRRYSGSGNKWVSG